MEMRVESHSSHRVDKAHKQGKEEMGLAADKAGAELTQDPTTERILQMGQSGMRIHTYLKWMRNTMMIRMRKRFRIK